MESTRPSERNVGPLVTVSLVLAVLCAAFFAPAFDRESQFLFRDAGRMHWPMKAWIAQELSRGHLPQWNPAAGVGIPAVATGVDAVLHPFNLLLVALPFSVGFKAWIILSVLAAGIGGAWWGERLGAGPARIVGGVAFMLTGFVASSTDNLTYLTTLAAIPWWLAAGHAYASRGGPGRLALVAAASFLCAAAGDPMGWGVALGVAAGQAYLVGRKAGAGRRALAVAAVSVAAAAPVVLPIVLWAPHSVRAWPLSDAEYRSWNLAPARVMELLVPHISRGTIGEVYNPVYEALAPDDPTRTPWVLSVYCGASAAALALFGASRNRAARVLLVVAAAASWAAMGHHAGFGALARALPGFGSLRYWEKLAAWPALFLAGAAALGAAAILADARAARRFSAACAVGALLFLVVAAGAWVAPDAIGRAIGPGARGPGVRALLSSNVTMGALHTAGALLATAAAVWIAQRRSSARAAVLVIATAVALDLAVANRSAVVLSHESIVAADSPLAAAALREEPFPRVVTPFELPRDRSPGLRGFDALWWAGARTLVDSWNVPRAIGNFDAYTALVPDRLAAVREALQRRGLARRAGLWGFSFAVTPADPGAVAQLQLPGPIEVAALDPGIPAWLVRIPRRPRAYFAEEVLPATAEQAIAFARLEDPASGRSVVEGTVPPAYATRGDARVVADEGERVILLAELTGDSPGLLVLSDQYAPGWTVEVDGAPAPIVRANALVRGVWVQPGQRHVVFRYTTPGLLEGLGVAAFAAGALGVWALLRYRGRRRRV